MSTAIQFRGGTTAQHATFTGASREVTVDTDKHTVVVHDGVTPGGFPLARALYDLSTDFDFSAAITPGTAHTLYTPYITKPRGVYLVTPYILNFTVSNAGGSYFVETVAEFQSGDGSSGYIVYPQVNDPVYNTGGSFLLRIASETATLRFTLTNEGSNPPGQGTVTVPLVDNITSGVYFDVYRIA